MWKLLLRNLDETPAAVRRPYAALFSLLIMQTALALLLLATSAHGAVCVIEGSRCSLASTACCAGLKCLQTGTSTSTRACVNPNPTTTTTSTTAEGATTTSSTLPIGTVFAPEPSWIGAAWDTEMNCYNGGPVTQFMLFEISETRMMLSTQMCEAAAITPGCEQVANSCRGRWQRAQKDFRLSCTAYGTRPTVACGREPWIYPDDLGDRSGFYNFPIPTAVDARACMLKHAVECGTTLAKKPKLLAFLDLHLADGACAPGSLVPPPRLPHSSTGQNCDHTHVRDHPFNGKAMFSPLVQLDPTLPDKRSEREKAMEALLDAMRRAHNFGSDMACGKMSDSFIDHEGVMRGVQYLIGVFGSLAQTPDELAMRVPHPFDGSTSTRHPDPERCALFRFADITFCGADGPSVSLLPEYALPVKQADGSVVMVPQDVSWCGCEKLGDSGCAWGASQAHSLGHNELAYFDPDDDVYWPVKIVPLRPGYAALDWKAEAQMNLREWLCAQDGDQLRIAHLLKNDPPMLARVGEVCK